MTRVKAIVAICLSMAFANSCLAADPAARAQVADANKAAASAPLDKEEMAKQLANPIANMFRCQFSGRMVARWARIKKVVIKHSCFNP